MARKAAKKSFGQTLREKRIAKGYSLRKFAEKVKVSPTYLSQVEQNKVAPPTAERVRTIAEELGASVDEWTALAGRLTDDLPDIIHAAPSAVPDLLRAIRGLNPDQLRELRKRAERMKGDRRH